MLNILIIPSYHYPVTLDSVICLDITLQNFKYLSHGTGHLSLFIVIFVDKKKTSYNPLQYFFKRWGLLSLYLIYFYLKINRSACCFNSFLSRPHLDNVRANTSLSQLDTPNWDNTNFLWGLVLPSSVLCVVRVNISFSSFGFSYNIVYFSFT